MFCTNPECPDLQATGMPRVEYDEVEFIDVTVQVDQISGT